MQPLFDDIAATYDRLNKILSLGIDNKWRQELVKLLPKNQMLQVLDIACGTADLLINITKARSDLKLGIGVDIAQKMLDIGLKKIENLKYEKKLKLINADAKSLPFLDNSFDAVTIAFGIRNIDDKYKALKEMHRVLKPGGLLLILEFSLPKIFFIKYIYLFYFRHILPYIGGLISGNIKAYRYLNKSVEGFYSTKDFLKVLRINNFSDIRFLSLTFGIATIYIGRK